MGYCSKFYGSIKITPAVELTPEFLARYNTLDITERWQKCQSQNGMLSGNYWKISDDGQRLVWMTGYEKFYLSNLWLEEVMDFLTGLGHKMNGRFRVSGEERPDFWGMMVVDGVVFTIGQEHLYFEEAERSLVRFASATVGMGQPYRRTDRVPSAVDEKLVQYIVRGKVNDPFPIEILETEYHEITNPPLARLVAKIAEREGKDDVAVGLITKFGRNSHRHYSIYAP
jgi:hypothetical protein